MEIETDLDVFLKPRSVAVIGATERPGSWGSFIMEGLLSRGYSGEIYPVNHKAGKINGLTAFKDVREIEGQVDLAILTIPEESVENVIAACGEKKVAGLTLITAGYGETGYAEEEGKERELKLVELARSHGIRILGPNVSGTFNLHAEFNASASPAQHLYMTDIAAICQGGYAFYDLLASGFSRGMGVGKFIHTGNECDLTVTDFLEHIGKDPNVKAILMYLETIRDGRRFIEIAKKVTKTKPVVVYKAGKTPGAARAARSHTGALSGNIELYEGLLQQAGITVSPSMELLLPIGHALIERPPMRGKRLAIVTMGGSWGVALSDSLEEAGLIVPELSRGLQERLKALGMPDRASTKNPVDIGASGIYYEIERIIAVGREVAISGEADALILHGVGRPGIFDNKTPAKRKLFLDINMSILDGYLSLEKEIDLPIFIGSHFSPWESQEIFDLNEKRIRVYNQLNETAQILSLMHDNWRKGQNI